MTKLNKPKITKAIPGTAGIIQAIADKCEVSRTRMSIYLNNKKNKDMMDLVQEEKERIIDFGESKLIAKIKEGDFAAIKWFLTCQGKSRGYGERQEIEHFGQSSIKIEFAEPIKNKK